MGGPAGSQVVSFWLLSVPWARAWGLGGGESGSLVLGGLLSPLRLPGQPVPFLRALTCLFELVTGVCSETRGLWVPDALHPPFENQKSGPF